MTRRRSAPPAMREVRIPKRNGKYRMVVVPSKAQRDRLRLLIPQLNAIAMTLDVHSVQHGFTPARNAVTCASQHIGFAYTVSFDLADCFDNVKQSQVQAVFTQNLSGEPFYHGIARQGLPTSPAMCNIALSALDWEIVAKLADRGVYTRYADDLTVSTDDRNVINEFLTDLPAMVQAHGHTVNPSKTSLQTAQGGRRIIVGVAVDATGIHPTRKSKRRLRAALHQKRKAQARGLMEWIALKPPDWMKSACKLLSSEQAESHLLAKMIVDRHK